MVCLTHIILLSVCAATVSVLGIRMRYVFLRGHSVVRSGDSIRTSIVLTISTAKSRLPCMYNMIPHKIADVTVDRNREQISMQNKLDYPKLVN